MAVTGAAMVLAMLPDDSAGARRSLPSLVRTNTNRAGEELADVGPNFRMSYSSLTVSSETASSFQAFWLRASRNIRSRPAASMVMVGAPNVQ